MQDTQRKQIIESKDQYRKEIREKLRSEAEFVEDTAKKNRKRLLG